MILGDVIYQGPYFLAALFCGIVCGFAYDVLYVLCVFLKGGKLMRFLLDCIFSLLCAAVVFLVFFHINGFDIRWYIAMGFAVGFAIQRLTFAKPVAKLCFKVYNKIAFVYTKAVRFLHSRLKRGKKQGEATTSHDRKAAL